MKNCSRCKKLLPSESFYKDNSRRSKLTPRCKDCDRVFRRESRLRNPETHIKRNKRYYQKHKKRKAEYLKKWRAKNWFKANAHEAVTRAIKLGLLKRKSCEKCKNTKADAHHEDYGKPLEVMWLCRSCHMEQHSKSK